MRAKTGIHHRRNRWSIGYTNPILPSASSSTTVAPHAAVRCDRQRQDQRTPTADRCLCGKLPIIVVDCKASAGLHNRVAATPDHDIWTIGGSLRWDPLRGDPTSVANRLIQGEWEELEDAFGCPRQAGQVDRWSSHSR
jgi:hypothetical protein